MNTVKNKFKYFTQEQLNTVDTYLRFDTGVISCVKLHKYNNFLWTSGLGVKATTTLLCPLKELIGHKVKYHNFTGKLTSINLPYSKNSKFENQYYGFVFWDNGQKQIPSGWVKLSRLEFI